MTEEKSAFPPAKIGRRLRVPVFDIVDSAADVAQFQEPIEARGLHFKTYLQTAISGEGRSHYRTHIWGFVLRETPQEAVATLKASIPGTEFVPFADGWALWKETNVDVDPWSMLLVRPYAYGPEASLWCFAEPAALEPLQGLPDIEDVLWKF